MGFIDGSLKLYPRSFKLWLKKLKNCSSQQNTEELMKNFKLAHQSLKDEQSQCLLWQYALNSSSNFPLQEVNLRNGYKFYTFSALQSFIQFV